MASLPDFLMALAALAGSPALASEHPIQLRASARQMFVLAEQFAQSGRADRAEPILRLLAGDPDPEIRNEARYRHALLLESRGDRRQAAVLMRRILDDRPDAAVVRLRLATLLQQIGDETSARRELRALRSADLPPGVARFVDQLSMSLQARKPLGLQLELALAPDTNINRSTASETLGTVIGDFAIDSEPRSGLGVTLRGSAHARRALSGTVELTARLSSEANLYRRKAYSDVAVHVTAGPEVRLGRARLRAEAMVGLHWAGFEPYQSFAGLGLGASHPLDPVSHLRVDGGVRWVDNRLNDLQDGRSVSVRARFERALSPQMLVMVSAGADRFTARDAGYSTRSWNGGITVYRDVGRATLSAGVEVGRLEADDRLALLLVERKDRATRLHLGAVFRQFTVAGFAPMMRLVVERNRSNVEIYDYSRRRTEFGVSRAF